MLINFNKIHTIIPIFKIEFYRTQYSLYSKSTLFKSILKVLKYHFNFNFKILTFITTSDFPDNIFRFKVIYEILTLKFNTRLRLKLVSNELVPIYSINKIYTSSIWWEHEIWDMFGLIFLKQKNLVRLLTDYGFQGFPLKKDFPLSGFIESKYNLLKNKISYENLELTQSFRSFTYESPWNIN